MTTYGGLVCERHPANKGLRYVCNGHCTKCRYLKNGRVSRPFPLAVALNRGLRFYRGSTCRRDVEHGNKRYVVTGACVECAKAAARKNKRYVKTGYSKTNRVGTKHTEESKLKISLALKRRYRINSLHADTGYANV